jgi:predicted ATPase/class 3 adenylate cyclase
MALCRRTMGPQEMGLAQISPPSIPAPLSRFVGRRRELDQLRGLVGPGRLVTIAGAGGCGKTRLAIELARSLGAAYSDGVWLVEFARIDDPAHVALTIADSVRALRHPGADRIESAAQTLSIGRQLLVLDNCEHVLAAASTAAEFLLARCPALTVLATSREPLGLAGERVWRLSPLSLPAPGDSGQSESVELFRDRARLVAEDAPLRAGQAADIATICRRLDGLPLALELVAAWVSVISLQQVVAGLEQGLSLLGNDTPGAPARHRTMRAAVDWSYQLLTPSLQTAFERLSVFAGGFSLDSADAVLTGGVAGGASTLDVIASLVARSLVVADTAGDVARYRLLEPVRQCAAEKQQGREGGSSEPRRRLLEYLVGVAEVAEEQILGGPDMPWLRLLDAELDNIRSILPWAFENAHEEGCRLAAALIWFAYIRSLYDDGIQWATEAMRTTGRLRARAAHMAAVLSSQRGDAGGAERYLSQARDLTVCGGWRMDLTMVMFHDFVMAYHRGDVDVMRSGGQAALVLARELGDEPRIMHTLFVPATLAQLQGDSRTAIAVLREAISCAQRRSADWSAWMFRASLAEVLIGCSAWTEALEVVRESLRSASDFGDAPITTASLVEYVGVVAVERGEPLEGLRLMAAARATFDRLRYRETPADADRRRHCVEAARRDLELSRADAAWEAGLGLTLAEATVEAQEFVGIAPPLSTRLRRPHQTTKTFMFTDVVGSTVLISAIGDDAWQDLIDWHHRVLRAAFIRHQGDEVDSAGDGFFVAFPDARAAADCAIDIQRTLAEHRRSHGFSPSVRIGLHETASTRSGNVYRGKGVHLAARIAAQASGDQILVSGDTATQLAPWYQLSPPRSVELKGFHEPAPVAALDWR